MKLKKMLAGHLLVLVLAFQPAVFAADFNTLGGNDPAIANAYSCSLILKNAAGNIKDDSSGRGQGHNYTVRGSL